MNTADNQTTLYCLDFDETLMNTDRLRQDLAQAIQNQFGQDVGQAYSQLYEEIRESKSGVSIPLVLHELVARKIIDAKTHRKLARLFQNFDYQGYLYDGAEEVVRHLKQKGVVIIFSDGDEFFQSQKIHATSVSKVVDQVIIVPNKVEYFAQLEGFYPADNYTFFDDKARVLDSAREYFDARTTTIHVGQGRYAQMKAVYPFDATIQTIREILDQV